VCEFLIQLFLYHACMVTQGCITTGQSNAISQILITHISVTAELLLIKLETKNYHPKITHHAKLYLYPTTRVVWANTQFATIWVLCLFWFLSHMHRLHQWTILMNFPKGPFFYWHTLYMSVHCLAKY